MKRRLLIVYLLIVLLPLAVLGWLGGRFVSNEREITQHRFRDILTNKLRDVDSEIG